MVPFLWGPMAWRQIHGMAHVFDTRVDDDISEKVAELFILFLIGLAWVLPCNSCRTSYTEYLLGYLKKDLLEHFFIPRKVQQFAFDLHNMVNKKLERATCVNFDLVLRRSELWSVEFLPRELFGLVFIIALNFNSNQEPDKEMHYKEFFSVLPHLLVALENKRMAVALEQNIQFNSHWTQDGLLHSIYNAFTEWHRSEEDSVPSYESIVEMYNLCRAA